MHSSRMRTARSSSYLGGSPPGILPGAGTPHTGPGTPHPGPGTPTQDQAPLTQDQAPAWSRHPPGRSPSTSPLSVGLETPLETCCKACWETTCNACWDSTPCRQTHTCKHITLPQTSFAGGNEMLLSVGNILSIYWTISFQLFDVRRRQLCIKQDELMIIVSNKIISDVTVRLWTKRDMFLPTNLIIRSC